MKGYAAALAGKNKSRARAASRNVKGKILAKLGQLRQSRRPSDKLLDDLWAELVKARDIAKYGPKCRMCGWRDGNTAYHIVPKQLGHHIRWLPQNGLLSCGPCNGGENWNRTLYRVKHVKMFGADFIDGLEAKAIAGRGFPTDRFAVFVILTQELKKLKGTHASSKGEVPKDKALDGPGRARKLDAASGLPRGSTANASQERGHNGPAVRGPNEGAGVRGVHSSTEGGGQAGASKEAPNSDGV